MVSETTLHRRNPAEHCGEKAIQDPRPLLVGGQANKDRSDDELEHEQESEDRAHAEFIEAWKTMYRRKGIDLDTYHIDGDALIEDERGE